MLLSNIQFAILLIFIYTLFKNLKKKSAKVIHIPSQQFPQIQPRFNIPTSFNPSRSFDKIGIVYSTDPEEDTLFNLYGRQYPTDRNRFQYRIKDNETGITINLNNGEPLPELFNNSQIQIVGKESIGDFTVLLDF